MIIISIYVVGVGPWDPELITVKAIKVLSKADVIFYGSLINEEVIRMYAPRAEKIYMGHVRGDDHREYVIEALRMARKGLNVVFLKNGDPVIFGRGIEICREAISNGIHCEVIPGVSSFTAAAARYLIELRGTIILTAYPNIDLNTDADVRVIFMGSKIAKELIHRLGDNNKIIIISRVTYPDEEARGIDVNAKVDELNVRAPSLIFVIRRGEHGSHGT